MTGIVETPGRPAIETTTEEEDRLDASAAATYKHSKAAATATAYRSDWADFTAFCDQRNYPTLPADPVTVRRYLTLLVTEGPGGPRKDHRATTGPLKVSSVQRRATAISMAHQYAGLPSPTQDPVIREYLKGLRREKTVRPAEARPISTQLLRQMIEISPDHLAGLRDRALLLLGFAGALRRSELVALDVEDLTISDSGCRIVIRSSKGDPEGAGQVIGVLHGHGTTDPVAAIQTWIERAEITTGPLFRTFRANSAGITAHRPTGDVVTNVIKKYLIALGADPTGYSAHSLRAGLITAAAGAGASERDIMAHSRHKSVTVARKYIREGSVFRDNVSGMIGL